jgi:two-component system response regulator AtoC
LTANQDVNTLRNPQDPILVVDDDPVQHVLIKGFLRNWQVIFASSALEALKILTNQDILLVVTDLHMPGMDGMDLLRRIKQHNGTVQVIVITASEQTEDLVDALRAGANDFLLKPLERQALEEVLENALTRINRWKQSLMTLFNKKIGHGRLDATQAN